MGVLLAAAALGVLKLLDIEVPAGVFVTVIVVIVVGGGILAEQFWGGELIERCDLCGVDVPTDVD